MGRKITKLTSSYPSGATPFTKTATSAANTAQTITQDAEAGKSHYITAIEVSIIGAAAVNTINAVLKEDTTAVWSEIIELGASRGTRTGISLSFPIKITTGKAANLVIDAGGASVVTIGNITGYTL